MNKLNKNIVYVTILLFISISSAFANSNDATIQQGVNQVLKKWGRNDNIGISVQAMDTGKILYQRNPEALYNTASTMKLFTAVAGLEYLGADFTFTTQLASDSVANNGILPGNLYIKFTGDPELKTVDLNNLISTLTQHGIHQVKGNLIIDDTTLDRDNWGPGWMWDELHICYAAPAIAVIINHNCVDAELIPSKQINSPPVLQMAPNATGVTISNEAVTKTTATEWECPLNLRLLGNNRYRLSGCIAPGQQALPLQIALDNPSLAAANILLSLLKQHNITMNGNIIYGKMPVGTTIIATHNSPPLSTIIKIMLKESDNLMADVIFKTIGAHYFHSTGTWANGAAAVKAILAPRTGINFDKLVMDDGAGLSRYNLVSPAQFTRLINYAYHVPKIKNVFYQALPIMGIDGTLKRELKDTPYVGKIHAKTGTMASTNTLVGYVQTNQGQTLGFAILINGFTKKTESYEALQDQLCKVLANA